jgi:hypothetical protein
LQATAFFGCGQQPVVGTAAVRSDSANDENGMVSTATDFDPGHGTAGAQDASALSRHHVSTAPGECRPAPIVTTSLLPDDLSDRKTPSSRVRNLPLPGLICD